MYLEAFESLLDCVGAADKVGHARVETIDLCAEVHHATEELVEAKANEIESLVDRAKGLLVEGGHLVVGACPPDGWVTGGGLGVGHYWLVGCGGVCARGGGVGLEEDGLVEFGFGSGGLDDREEAVLGNQLVEGETGGSA